MSRDRSWGDELTLRAACNAFGVCVHVVDAAGTEAQHWTPHALDGGVAGQDNQVAPREPVFKGGGNVIACRLLIVRNQGAQGSDTIVLGKIFYSFTEFT